MSHICIIEDVAIHKIKDTFLSVVNNFSFFETKWQPKLCKWFIGKSIKKPKYKKQG